MKKILFISSSFAEQKMVEDMIQGSGKTLEQAGLQLETTASFGQDIAWWNTNPPAVLVINLPSEAALQLPFFNRLRTTVPKNIPLILLGESISGAQMQMTTIFSRVRVIKKPLEANKVYQAVLDLSVEFQAQRQQISPRYPTDQVAKITTPEKADSFDGIVKNLSTTGAFVEVAEDKFSLKTGEECLLQIVIPGQREYKFPGKIVWVRKLETTGFGFGINFHDTQVIPDSL